MFTLSIKTDNAAFEASENDKVLEISRILRRLADDLDDNGSTTGTLRDYNGNSVGKYELLPC
jgi:hypothetical protein